jgi:lactate dehydrogenase-like 2-hydroxyacid dehydrogenase
MLTEAHRKLVITETVGTDHIDLEECRKRGVKVMYVPNASVESVSEHALSLVSSYYLIRDITAEPRRTE